MTKPVLVYLIPGVALIALIIYLVRKYSGSKEEDLVFLSGQFKWNRIDPVACNLSGGMSGCSTNYGFYPSYTGIDSGWGPRSNVDPHPHVAHYIRDSHLADWNVVPYQYEPQSLQPRWMIREQGLTPRERRHDRKNTINTGGWWYPNWNYRAVNY